MIQLINLSIDLTIPIILKCVIDFDVRRNLYGNSLMHLAVEVAIDKMIKAEMDIIHQFYERFIFVLHHFFLLNFLIF